VTAELNVESLPLRRSERLVTEEYFELKTKIHSRLLDLLDLSLIDTLERNALRAEIKSVIGRILRQDEMRVPLNLTERERLFEEILDEVLGLGPLEPFLQDPTVSDILANTYDQIYLERFGRLERTDARFKDNDHLMKIIDKIVSAVGRRIDESSPMVDARLPDGSRVNAIISPLAIDGPMLSIRRFAAIPLELENLLEFETLTPEIGEILSSRRG
jgi:pilus assembly protein CpaF